jgi:hypothetical protein
MRTCRGRQVQRRVERRYDEPIAMSDVGAKSFGVVLVEPDDDSQEVGRENGYRAASSVG